MRIGDDEHCLQLGVQLFVGERLLKFELKICHGAQALNQRARAYAVGVIGQKALVGIYRDVADVRRGPAQKAGALFHGEKRALGRVDYHQHHHLVEQLCRALDDVYMAFCHRVEAARADGDAHVVSPFFAAYWPPPAQSVYFETSTVPYRYCLARRSAPHASGSCAPRSVSASTTPPGASTCATAGRMAATVP